MKLRLSFLSILPLIFLLGAIVVSYLYMPMEWFLVSTGLLILFSVFSGKDSKPAEKPAPPQTGGFDIKNILEGLADAAFVYDQNFRIITLNRNAEKLFNVKSEELLGETIDPRDAENPRWQRLVQVVFPSLSPSMSPKSREGEFPQIIDLSFTDPELELSTVTSRISDSAGRPIGFLKVVRDRTEEVTLMKEKNEFITVASHQLRTPVTSIVWAMEGLSSSAELPESLKEIVSTAQSYAKNLSTLVEDLLNVSKIEEGKFGYEMKTMDIVDFMNKILTAVFPQAKRSGIKLFFDKPAEGLPPVFIDENKLSMAVSNLLDNAIRYNVQDGEVVVKIKKDAQTPFIEVSIRDTGIGIPKEEADNLFNRFFRASNALKYQTTGSGLGLFITRNIIKTHGGDIKAESELNKGTVVTFTLPIQKELVPPREVPVI